MTFVGTVTFPCSGSGLEVVEAFSGFNRKTNESQQSIKTSGGKGCI